MKILLTGGSGFLGSYIQSELSSNNEIYSLSRDGSNYKCNLELDAPVFDQQFELVIHAAGLAHNISVNQNETDLFHKVNVIGTENLLKGLEHPGIPKKFIFISSVAVYGETVGKSITESSKLKAKDLYGQSKIQAESLVYNWCREKSVVCTILRLPLIVGSNPPGNLGAMIRGIKNGRYFNIADGQAEKSMVLASDVAKYILKASVIGGVFNLTDGYHPSFFELSENISRKLGKSTPKNLPLWLAILLARTGDFFGNKALLNSAKLHKIISDLTFDDSKARDAFGWDPTPVLEGFRIYD